MPERKKKKALAKAKSKARKSGRTRRKSVEPLLIQPSLSAAEREEAPATLPWPLLVVLALIMAAWIYHLS